MSAEAMSGEALSQHAAGSALEELPRAWRELQDVERQLGLADTLMLSYRPRSFRPRSLSPDRFAPSARRGDETVLLQPEPRADDTVAIAAEPESSESRSTESPSDPPPFEETGLPRRAALELPKPGAEEEIETLELIGEGGMGVVFRARQASLQREIALKRLKSCEDESIIALFRAEARVTGFLDHANIIPVHFLRFDTHGEPQMAMKLVKGTSWQSQIAREPRTNGAMKSTALREHLRILIEVCQAIDFAHSKNIIHRDLKPQNIMVGAYGQVFVMDWGLAVSLDNTLATQLGVLSVQDVRETAGTPAFMAPELARGEGARQGPWTDVYLLGACLHVVLTGQLRHCGENILATLRSAAQSESQIYPESIPAELAALCNRACAADIEKRPASVAAFREDLEAWLQHEQVYGLLAKAQRQLAELENELGDELVLSGSSPKEMRAQLRERDGRYAEIRFALRHALELWPESEEAQRALARARRVFLKEAMGRGDLHGVARVLGEIEAASQELDPDTQAELDALRAKERAKTAEIENLRAAAEQMDWSQVARPLGALFLLGGILGGLSSFASGLLWRAAERAGEALPVISITLLWALFCLVLGGAALLTLRRRGVRARLLSEQVLGTWTSVCVGCFFVGTSLGTSLKAAAPPIAACSIMVGVGLATTAMQAYRLLLAPAALFMLSGPLILLWPDRAMELFGLVWTLSCIGVGLALRSEPAHTPSRTGDQG